MPARGQHGQYPWATFSMTDITDPRWLWCKFGLFVLLGLLATGIALALYPSLRLAALMAIAIWAFCRAYYFAFYVIEHYIDPGYRFAGLVSLVRYAWRHRKSSDSAA
jgi:hypothetical protein